MTISPFTTIANVIRTAETADFKFTYFPNSYIGTQGEIYSGPDGPVGEYFSVLVPGESLPGGYQYDQRWVNYDGYENVGVMLQSHNGKYENSIDGGSGADVIFGNEHNDGIVGKEGNDLIMGGGGDDYSLMGLSGNDCIVAGYQLIDNGDPPEVFYDLRQPFLQAWKNLFSNPDMSDAEIRSKFVSFSGDSHLFGGEGQDFLVGGIGNDKFYGNQDDDIIFGGYGNDEIYGDSDPNAFGWTPNQKGKDTIYGESGNDTIHGGGGDDTIYGGNGDDPIHGEDGNDIIYGENGKDTIHGGSGDDTIYGGNGDDPIHGGSGDDTIYGGNGDDPIHGGDGNDELLGNSGIDEINGDEGDDLIGGGAGDDEIYGGPGNDQIHGGPGVDTVQGNAGNDIFVLSSGYQVTIVTGQVNDGTDTIYVTSDVLGLNISKDGTDLLLVSSNNMDGVLIEDWFSNHCVERLAFQSSGMVYDLVAIGNAMFPPAAPTAFSPEVSMLSQEIEFGLSPAQVNFTSFQPMDIELSGISSFTTDTYLTV